MIESLPTDPENALVLAPAATPIESVRRAFDPGVSFDEWNVLLVAYGDDHGRLRAAWHDRIGDRPANFGSVSVASDIDVRCHTAPVSQTGRDVATTVHDPTDLAELGITISLYLDDWTAGRTLVCFHSIDDLVAHVGTEAAFRFLHVLACRLADAGAIGQFPLDPTALNESTVRTFESLFDAVYEADTDENPPSITPDTAFDVLRAPRRRYVLHYLRRRAEPTTVGELTDWVTKHDPDGSDRRIEISLHHTHLPKLEDAGLIAHNGARVAGRPAIASLAPYLELVLEHDLPE